MEPIKFGNWKLVEEGIEWDGGIDYLIPRSGLIDTIAGSQGQIYEWLIHMVEKAWLKVDDIYALNNAFIYATKHFGLTFNYEIFIATLIDQNES